MFSQQPMCQNAWIIERACAAVGIPCLQAGEDVNVLENNGTIDGLGYKLKEIAEGL